MTRMFLIALASAASLADSQSASACGTGRIALTDGFDSLNTKLWGDGGSWMSVTGGAMVISEDNDDFFAVPADRMFRNVDVCADVAMTDGENFSSSYGGIVFWARSPEDFYTFQITLDGYADVYRYDGTWNAIIDDVPFDSIKQGLDAKNELRVVTTAGTAAFYVNGVAFDSITADHPPGTSRVGLIVDAGSKGVATFQFDNFTVRDPVY